MRTLSRRTAPLIAAVLTLAGCGGSHHETRNTKRATGSCPGYVTAYGCQAHPETFGLPPAGTPLRSVAAPVPTIEMRDSVTVSAIPRGTPAVAGYVNGSWADFGGMVAAFPNAQHVSIAVNTAASAKCLDVEPGDAVPSQAGPWDRQQLARGIKPCDYASLANMGAVEASIAATLGAGWRARVLLWDANWTFFAHLDVGFDCTQWTDHGPQGQNYDESTCVRSFYGLVKPSGPTVATVRHWRAARNASFSAYHDDRCKLALTGECGLLAHRVRYFQARLWTVERRWTCFGRHARTGSDICWIVRPVTAWRSRARDLTGRARIANGCFQVSVQRPVNRRECALLDRRYEHFAELVKSTVKAYR